MRNSETLKCPACAERASLVVDTRMSVKGEAIRRRRECCACGHKFNTYEFIVSQTINKYGDTTKLDRAPIPDIYFDEIEHLKKCGNIIDGMKGLLANQEESR